MIFFLSKRKNKINKTIPIITNNASSYFFKEPYFFSAIAAHLASFSKYIGISNCFFSSLTILSYYVQNKIVFDKINIEVIYMCVFCKIINGEIPSFKVYENDNVLCFLDINASSKGHTLIIKFNRV